MLCSIANEVGTVHQNYRRAPLTGGSNAGRRFGHRSDNEIVDGRRWGAQGQEFVGKTRERSAFGQGPYLEATEIERGHGSKKALDPAVVESTFHSCWPLSGMNCYKMSFARWFLISWWSVTAWGGTLAQFRTAFGTIEVELLNQQRPETVANFIRYVQNGSYHDTFFHRLRTDYILTGGGYFAENRYSTNQDLNPSAYAAIPQLPGITNESTRGGIITNFVGTLSLGVVDKVPHPLGSEFFFSLSDASGPFFAHNQGGYPVFGRIKKGLEVLQFLNRFKPLIIGTPFPATNVLISIFDPNLPSYLYGTGQFPVTRLPPTSCEIQVVDQLTTLVYVDITLLNVAVTLGGNGEHKIEWDSVEGRPNVVEFTRVLPPIWEQLGQVKGTGGRMFLVDNSPETQRFHRVRVPY